MISRNYQLVLIRKTLDTKNISKCKYKQKHLKNLSKKLSSKRTQKILTFKPFAYQNKFDEDELIDVNNRMLTSDDPET